MTPYLADSADRGAQDLAAAPWGGCRLFHRRSAAHAQRPEPEEEHERQHQQSGDEVGKPAGDDDRQHHHEQIVDHVAGISAEAGGERPVAGHGQGRQGGAGGKRAADPGEALAQRPRQTFMREEANRPAHGNGEQHQHAEAEELHQLVGNDSTRIAEPVARCPVKCVVERGIVHRPGRQRYAGGNQAEEQHDAGHLEQAPLEENPDRGGDRTVIGIVGRLIRHRERLRRGGSPPALTHR